MHDVAKSPVRAVESGHKESLKERAIGELRKFAVIAAYLWLLFALFGLHKQLVQGQGISVWQQGFALINALVFGKVILIADALQVAKGSDDQALAWIVLRRSFIFAVLLLAFHIAEEVVGAYFKGRDIATIVPDMGGLAGLAAYCAIFSVVLIPFFAFHEASRVLGADFMWRLFFHPASQAAGAGQPTAAQ
jgi:hypothetical protein